MKNFWKCHSLTIILAAIIIMTNSLVAIASSPATATNSSATGTVAAQGASANVAWYELLPDNAVFLFKVDHGDQMGVWIENYDGSWIINVVDYTSGQYSPQSVTYTTDVRSLDWIVEHA